MFPEGENGDLACFTCGNVIYHISLPAAALLHPGEEPRVAHGGRSLK